MGVFDKFLNVMRLDDEDDFDDFDDYDEEDDDYEEDFSTLSVLLSDIVDKKKKAS